MQITALAIFLVLQCCELCFTIRVPVVWNDDDVQHKESNEDFSVEEFKPQIVHQKPIPVEYFEYTAKKPRIAIDIAASHGVESPENYYKAHPVRLYTGIEKPQFGNHRLLDKENNIFEPFQKYVKKNAPKQVVPISSNYEVFHPYKAEEPLLQAIYKDPVLHKIRHDLDNNKNRLQNYEKQAEQLNVGEEEYLESPEETDKKLFPQENTPVEFEIHRPQRRPAYYTVQPKSNHRDQILNEKLRHSWNQDYVKIRPKHYQPLKNHILDLKQQHATKYDDERNEYPQIQVSQNIGDPEEGYDIYERGNEKFVQLRNDFDESINKAVLENKPASYKKLELQNSEGNAKNEEEEEDDEEEFVPVKNYAQVRKTETVKHLPREAALEDAENYEEIQNAPRLREAVKSKKAQTVYSEEGYEDSAYDHAGEQKHASENEDHAGYLKQLEESRGRYKAPSLSTSFNDGEGSEYKDQVLHSEIWDDDKKNKEEETEDEEYSDVEDENSAEADNYSDKSTTDLNRNKREDKNQKYTDDKVGELETNKTRIPNDGNKEVIEFTVPEINLDDTFLTGKEIVEIAKVELEPEKDNIEDKYPYYFKSLDSISKHSPLRYAENFKFIPNKSEGGTEFYDSRVKLVCPEVEDVDPLPDNLKNGKLSNDSNEKNNESISQEKGAKSFEILKEQPRLSGLGDKIDCFKAKYFGENPLDNPFFKEEIISVPEPITVPSLSTYNLKHTEEPDTQESNIVNLPDSVSYNNRPDIFTVLDKLRANPSQVIESTVREFDKSTKSTMAPVNISVANMHLANESNVYSDVLNNIKNNEENITSNNGNPPSSVIAANNNESLDNTTYNFFKNKEDFTIIPYKLRKKRATTFIYEPYKIIRENQAQDTKKTVTGNISPLLKQMQTSKVVDRVTRANRESDKKYNSNRAYKDIGRDDRLKTQNIEDILEDNSEDIKVNQRRGEPTHESKQSNDKTEYIPVGNKKSISIEDYKSQVNTEKNNIMSISQQTPQIRRNFKQRRPTPPTTAKPVVKLSKDILSSPKVQNVAASNTVRKILATTTSRPDTKASFQGTTDSLESEEDNDNDEEYEEYDEEDDMAITITTTTTVKPTEERKQIITTAKSLVEFTTQVPKLRLVTRFRNFNQEDTTSIQERQPEGSSKVKNGENINRDVAVPKYREKKKKSSKSTIVTDTKKYGDDDDDMRREEVDALIGIKHDMNDYVPLYEKEANAKRKHSHELSSEEISEETIDDDDTEMDNNEEDEEDEEEETEDEEEPEVTTAEPPRRTLPRTTIAPLPTVASHKTLQKQTPIISKKTVEIHKELPVNKSSPHMSAFKQDIKEVEIIKVIPPKPKKKHEKHTEALDLYKDDNLAIAINKLSDVEVFKEDLDFKNGPRHGGNYREAPFESDRLSSQKEETKVFKDTETSETENTKQIELTERPQNRMHGGNLKSINDYARSRNRGRSAKLIELSDITQKPLTRAMHGGNLRLDSNVRRSNKKYEKLTELDDDKHDDDSSSKDNNYRTYNSRNGGAMHGGNYRSAKIVRGKNSDSEYDIKVKADNAKDPRRNAAVLLNSFAQAVPVMTTTPGYILDPSKRMYYYVEA